MATDATFSEEWLPGHDGIQFYTRTYAASAPRAVVIFVHGFSEHISRYEWAHSLCAARGITVFAYDQRGYGRTALDSAHKSKGSAFGKTSLRDGLLDLEWWLQHLRKQNPSLPLFAFGNSMGGALVLAFVTRTSPPPSPDAVALLSGVVCSGTLLYQHLVKSKALRFACRKASAIAPYLVIDAPIPSNQLTRNPSTQAALKTDRYAVQKGSLKALTDMLDVGENIWRKDHLHWPRALPILLLHGSMDKVTCFKSAQQFIEKLDADDKTFIAYPDAYHELFHEPEGVKEKFMDDCTSWVISHAAAISRPESSTSSASADSEEANKVGADGAPVAVTA